VFLKSKKAEKMNTSTILRDNSGTYYTDKKGNNPLALANEHLDIIDMALAILDLQLKTTELKVTNSKEVKDYLRLKLQLQEREVFAVMFFDTQHNLIEYDEMFAGTLNNTSIHPREIAKKALLVNAAAVIISHNHPSGEESPSSMDIKVTKEIEKVLSLFDIRLLDHLIIAANRVTSFAERNLL